MEFAFGVIKGKEMITPESYQKREEELDKAYEKVMAYRDIWDYGFEECKNQKNVLDVPFTPEG
jgi:hypothetical protein